MWEQAQQYEKGWHERISTNTYHEEEKQFEYARCMGLEFYADAFTPYNLKNYGRVLDIGGGETSLLLKVEHPEFSVVLDPCDYPQWVVGRYNSKGIKLMKMKGEDCDLMGFDEVWIYNCLQHTEDPERIIKNALRAGKLIRIFEWINMPAIEGHIHTLTKKELDNWLGGYGKEEQMNGHGCYGTSYYGIFNGKV